MCYQFGFSRGVGKAESVSKGENFDEDGFPKNSNITKNKVWSKSDN